MANYGYNKRDLEKALLDVALRVEGPIAEEFIAHILTQGKVLDALRRVYTSVMLKNPSLMYGKALDNNAFLIVSAWANYEMYGSPGFPLGRTEEQNLQYISEDF